MPEETCTPFVMRPYGSQSVLESNNIKYRNYAHELLTQLESLAAEVQENWPKNVESITDKNLYPELWKLIGIRDRTSDSVRIYAALAVEGFLNFYGVLRLGQNIYDDHFEKLGLITKLRKLILISENIVISQKDPLVKILESIASDRNSLVHPKVREYSNKSERSSIEIPGSAKNAVTNMEAFFEQFTRIVPLMKHHINPRQIG